DLDFPHLMLRYRAMDHAAGKTTFTARQLAKTDRNGAALAPVAPLVNWANDDGNPLTRPILEGVAGIDRKAALPKFHGQTFARRAREPVTVNREAPGFGRKAVLYATCFVNYNNPDIGTAARAVLAKNGVETEVVYPACCGMPVLEQGDLAGVARQAQKVAPVLGQWIDKGYDVIALIPSCALMLKFEWPLIVPGDAAVKKLSEATYDVAEYLVELAKKPGLA